MISSAVIRRMMTVLRMPKTDWRPRQSAFAVNLAFLKMRGGCNGTTERLRVQAGPITAVGDRQESTLSSLSPRNNANQQESNTCNGE